MPRIERPPRADRHSFFELPFTRRRFLEVLATVLGALALSPTAGRRAWAQQSAVLVPRTARTVQTACRLAVSVGQEPGPVTRKAVETLGGIGRFVRPGDTVVVKPNMGWDRSPEQAANTHPAVVAALVTLCREAGAKRVKVFDNTCNDARRTYQNSGIAAAAKQAGATVLFMNEQKYATARLSPEGPAFEWPLYRDALECDCFINVPVAKHHGLTKLTLSMKNLMGICAGARGKMHWDIEQKLAELTQFVRPDLTVIDATRILLRNGPTGGDLADVEVRNTVIASADPVLADAYATTLFGLKPQEIGYIRRGAELGLGSLDLSPAGIVQVKA